MRYAFPAKTGRRTRITSFLIMPWRKPDDRRIRRIYGRIRINCIKQIAMGIGILLLSYPVFVLLVFICCYAP